MLLLSIATSMSLWGSSTRLRTITPINQYRRRSDDTLVDHIVDSQSLILKDTRTHARGYTPSWDTRSHPTLTHLNSHPHTRPSRHLRLHAP
jgi:hypothetical protein